MNPSYRIASSLIERAKRSGHVASGPFKGTLLTPGAEDHQWNKTMGAYEFYLHDAVEDAIQRRPPLCIDVGAAEGYYTLGLAHRLPGSRHIAYEMVDEFRAILSQSIAKQPVPVQVKGICTREELIRDLASSAEGFLVMDCEGAEEMLLTAETMPHLKRWTVLLEVHDFQAPGAGEKILKLFADSHSVKVLQSWEPEASDLSAFARWPLNQFCRDAFRSLFDEGRNCTMRFFYFTPR
ncbi:MAG: hypothetical protein ACK59A_07190 [Cyanobacteriota bacterium]